MQQLTELVDAGKLMMGSSIKVADYDLRNGTHIALELYRHTDTDEKKCFEKVYHIDVIADFLRNRGELEPIRTVINSRGEVDFEPEYITVYDWIQNTTHEEKTVLFEIFCEKHPELHKEMDIYFKS